MMGGDGWTSASLIERAGNSLEGCYHSDHYSADSDEPHVRKFVQSFTKRYGHAPNSLAALGYDAAWILAEAMRRSEDLEPATIRKQIAQTKDYPAVTGKITINPERNAEKSAVVLQIRGKAVHYVTTIEPRK
jgi:branched-chain amino acid transport system substrate-binding protein